MIYDVCLLIHLKTTKRQNIELKMNELSLILSLLHRKHNFKLHFIIQLSNLYFIISFFIKTILVSIIKFSKRQNFNINL